MMTSKLSLRWLKLTALFMCFLVVSMPAVFATSLSVQDISGNDGVRNFYNRDDTITIKALAAVEGEKAVETDQMRVYIDSESIFELFKSCNKTNSSFYECAYQRTLKSSTGKHKYTVALYSDKDKFKDDAAPLREITETMTVDVLPADVLKVDVLEKETGADIISIRVDAEDYAEKKGDTSVCSGVQELQITEDGVQKSTVIPESQFDCTFSDTISYSVGASGKTEICVRALDALGQSGKEQCDTVLIDKGPPVVRMSLRDKDGEARDFINPSKKYVLDAVAEIEDSGIDDKTVVGTFSRMTTSSAFVNRKYGRKEGNNYFWPDIPVDKFEVCEAIIPVKDTLGNQAPQPVTCGTQTDTVEPEMVSFSTNAPFEGMLGKGGEIIAEIKENGRVASKDVYLDLSSVTGQEKAPADSCELSGNWNCRWKVTPSQSGPASFSLHPDSTDRAGNSFSNSLEGTVTVDLSAPELKKITMQVPGKPEGIASAGDSVQFTLSVANTAVVIANLTSIGGGIVEGSCDTNACTVSGAIGAGASTSEVRFALLSRSGSRIDVPYTVNVLAVSEKEEDFWDSVVECSPNLVDRSTAELINHRVYCHIKLTPKDPAAEVVGVAMGPASSCEGDVQGTIANIQLGNAAAGTIDPYLQVTLTTSDFPEESISFSCPILISSKKGNVFYSQPETENARIEIGFYNLPLGDAFNNLNEKIEKAKDDAEGLWKIVGFLDKLVSYGRMICRIKQIIYNLIYGVDAIVKVFKGIGDVCYVTSPDPTKSECVAIHEIGDATCISKGPIEDWMEGSKASAGFFNYADKFCSFINCQMSNPNPQLNWNGVFSTLGGGGIMNYCANINNYLTDFVGTSAKAGTQTQNVALQPFSIQDSLVYSTLCTCVPGILYNLNKLRQIKCRYAVCLGVDVKEKGIPISACQDENNYLTCNYVFNQVFYLIPFASLLDTFLTKLQEIFKNPFAALGLVLGVICRINCNPTPGTSQTFWTCEIPNIISKISDAVASVISAFEGDLFDVGEDMCDDLDKIKTEKKKEGEEQEEKEKAGAGEKSKTETGSAFRQDTRETREEAQTRTQTSTQGGTSK